MTKKTIQLKNSKSIGLITFMLGLAFALSACSPATEKSQEESHNDEKPTLAGVESLTKKEDTIYLAGGCFWGVEEYFARIDGILDTEVGYANGKIEETSYETLRETGHAETLKLVYDANAIENELLLNYVSGEDYHQDYLKKNPGGYCHVDLSLADEPLAGEDLYQKPSEDKRKELLSKEEYEVTQNAGTEKPFSHPYDKLDEEGIYVDIVTGQPPLWQALWGPE